MDFLSNVFEILFCHLQTITFPLKYSAGSSSSGEWRVKQGLVQRPEQEKETRTSFLSHRDKARQELTQLLLLPAEATHTQGKAVTLL